MITRIAGTTFLTALGVCARWVAYGDVAELTPIDPSLRSGQWTYENGVRTCDGYMTRNPAEDYCASQPPGDWQSFEYEGRTYFIHRLSGD